MEPAQAHRILDAAGLDGPLETRGSFSNTVFLAPEAVLRTNSRPHIALLQNEQRVVAALPPDMRHAAVLDYSRDEQYEWMVNERLPGNPLAGQWHQMTLPARRRAIADLANQVRLLHTVELAPYPQEAAWKRGRRRIDFDDLPASMDSTLASLPVEARAAFEKEVRLLAQDVHSRRHEMRFGAVHCDLHLDNVLIDSAGAVTIIDYELTSEGDNLFDLEWFLQFCAWPKRLVPEESEDIVDEAQFRSVPAWLAGAYPAPLLGDGCRERLKLYFLWDLLEQAAASTSGDSWALEQAHAVLDDGGPMELAEAAIAAAKNVGRQI